jgi:hypothetical protein
MVEFVGGAAGPQEIAALLRPEALGTLSEPTIALLRAELADTLRVIFAAGAVMMAAAALIALRLEAIPVVQRRGRRGAAEAVPVPAQPVGTDARSS